MDAQRVEVERALEVHVLEHGAIEDDLAGGPLRNRDAFFCVLLCCFFAHFEQEVRLEFAVEARDQEPAEGFEFRGAEGEAAEYGA